MSSKSLREGCAHRLDVVTLRKEKQPKDQVFWAGYSWDIRDPDIGISRTKALCKWPFSVVLFRPGCPGIWVGTSRIWKNFMQEYFGLSFCSLGDPPERLMVHFGYGQRKKQTNQTFCGPKWPVWGPVFGPKIPTKKFMRVPFCVLSQETRHINFFLGSQNGVFWVGAKKFYVETVYVFFRSPTKSL